MNTDKLKDLRDALITARARARRAEEAAQVAWWGMQELTQCTEALVAAGLHPSPENTDGAVSNGVMLAVLIENTRKASNLARTRFIAASAEESRLGELAQLFGVAPLPARRPKPRPPEE